MYDMVQGCSAIKEILGSSRWWSIAFSSGDKTNSILGQMFPEVRLCRLDGMKLRGMCSPLLGPFKIPVAVAAPIADIKDAANVVRPSLIVLCSMRVGHKQPAIISMAVQIRHLHALAARNFRRRGWNRASYEPVQMALPARFLEDYLFLDVLRVPANDEIFERKKRGFSSFIFPFCFHIYTTQAKIAPTPHRAPPSLRRKSKAIGAKTNALREDERTSID